MLIFLGKNKTAIIDDEDYVLLSNYIWYAKKDKNSWYAAANKYDEAKHTIIKMHQIILGKRKGYVIDHINGNGLDNRKENLRFVTRSQNKMNQQNTYGSSKYKGVSWHKNAKKWTSYIRHNGKLTHLGLFSSEEEAARAYDSKAKELFKEFASLNNK